jgi:uncharacterized protein
MKNRLFSTLPFKFVILTVLVLIVCPIVEIGAKPTKLFASQDFPFNLRENVQQIDDGYKEAIEGEKYNVGLGVLIDKAKALELWKISAQKNHPIGLFNLGCAYFNGANGVIQDYTKGNEYLTKAFPGLEQLAKKGNAPAQCDLGDFFLIATRVKGMDLKKSYEFALYWYGKAIEQNYPQAQYNLGVLYRDGTGAGNGGVERNYEKAMELFHKAAEYKLCYAEFNLGILYREAKNFGKAKEWFEKAGTQKVPEIQYTLGFMHLNGEGVPKDSKKAIEYFEYASNQGSTDAQISIGRMYQEGLGIEKNLEKAKEWYKKAAAAGNAFAKEELQKMGVKD